MNNGKDFNLTLKEDWVKDDTIKYGYKLRLGIDDLISIGVNEYGEFYGSTFADTYAEYQENSVEIHKAVDIANEAYIEDLKAKGEYGKEVDMFVFLKHNPLFDDNVIPKSMESYRMIFLNPTDMNDQNQAQIMDEQKLINQQIVEVKELRVDIDKVIKEVQPLNVNRGYAEKVLALRKLQEAKMWLGQVLAELGSHTPYIHADNPANTIVSPPADVYVKEQNDFDKADLSQIENTAVPLRYTDGKFYFSLHFTIKEQTIDRIREGVAQFLDKMFIEKNISSSEIVILHTFLPYGQVLARKFSTELYDRVLNHYFKDNQICLMHGDIDLSRRDLVNELTRKNGTAVFIGEIKEGVIAEYNLMRGKENNILHF